MTVLQEAEDGDEVGSKAQLTDDEKRQKLLTSRASNRIE